MCEEKKTWGGLRGSQPEQVERRSCLLLRCGLQETIIFGGKIRHWFYNLSSFNQLRKISPSPLISYMPGSVLATSSVTFLAFLLSTGMPNLLTFLLIMQFTLKNWGLPLIYGFLQIYFVQTATAVTEYIALGLKFTHSLYCQALWDGGYNPGYQLLEGKSIVSAVCPVARTMPGTHSCSVDEPMNPDFIHKGTAAHRQKTTHPKVTEVSDSSFEGSAFPQPHPASHTGTPHQTWQLQLRYLHLIWHYATRKRVIMEKLYF